MSIHEVRIAHWRTARDRNGRELDLHPWTPSGATTLKTATIRHCAGCTACGDAVEVDPPCDNPRWCSPVRPCEGLRTAQEWARQHAGGTAPAVVTTTIPEAAKKAPGLHRPPRRPRNAASPHQVRCQGPRPQHRTLLPGGGGMKLQPDPLGYDLFDLAVIIAGSLVTAALIAVIVGGALLGWWS